MEPRSSRRADCRSLHLRRSLARRVHHEYLASLGETQRGQDPAQGLESRELLQQLNAAIAALPASYRQVFLFLQLVFINELWGSPEPIASSTTALDCSSSGIVRGAE